MTGMTKRTKKTTKSTKSASKKQSPSSTIPSSLSRGTKAKITRKTASQPLDEANRAKTSSSSSVSEKLEKTRSSGSSQPENRRPEKSDVWKGYDYDNLPELTQEQLATFKPITQEKHERFKQMVARGRRGRPRKSAQEKEHVHSIRLSDSFLQRLKNKAMEKGFTAWQTYVKKVLSEDIEQIFL